VESGLNLGRARLDRAYERPGEPIFKMAAGFMSGMPDGKFACDEIEVFAVKPQQA
jgi:hypothetical protein